LTDIPVVVPDEPFSLDDYFSPGLQPGEELLPQTPLTSDNEFVPNGELLSILEEMGFPSNRCEKALYNTGNSDPDAAMNWLFQHMEDPDIDDPLNLGKVGSNLEISEGSIAVLADMGFTVLQAKKSLKETGGDMERAVEWLFSHPDDDGSTPEAQSERTEVTAGDTLMPALFKLHSIICHKGASVHAGHYVTFIKKTIGEQANDAANDSDWVLFNDEKVVRGGEVDEMKKFAYVYFFERYRA
jgi:ubiquitin carboxyl-terminal hydrolase 5/13